MAGFAGWRALPVQLALLLATLQACQAAMAAWMTDIGPQLIIQNQTTGAIMYSNCNSNNTPIYSNDPAKSLKLAYQPKNGTSLAGVGWWTGKTTAASIFYQDREGRLTNALFNCDFRSGTFQSQGNYLISLQAPSVHNETGLAALLLGANAGYRVYYHDADQAVNQLTYTNAAGWNYDAVISQANPSSNAIHAVFSDTTNFNISVVTPFDDKDFQVTRWNTDKSWHISTAPGTLQGDLVTDATNRSDMLLDAGVKSNFTLAAWSGQPESIGISTDTVKTRFVWYIGDDSRLYQTASVHYVWQSYPNQSAVYWPKADSPRSEFALASSVDSSEVHIFYFVNRTITEVRYTNDGWHPAAALATYNASAPVPSNDTGGSTGADGSAGLSSGAKAGVGVGVSLGVMAVGGTALALWWFRRRAADQAAEASAVAEMDGQHRQPAYFDYASQPPYGSSAPTSPWGHDQKDYYHGELDTTPMAAEADSAPPRPVYELADQGYSHELVGSGAPTPVSPPPAHAAQSPLLHGVKP